MGQIFNELSQLISKKNLNAIYAYIVTKVANTGLGILERGEVINATIQSNNNQTFNQKIVITLGLPHYIVVITVDQNDNINSKVTTIYDTTKPIM